MENELSTKIRLLLNELAILNQPEKSGEKFIYQKDTISRIKTLSAELYLMADQAQMAGEFSSARVIHSPVAESPKPVLEEIPVVVPEVPVLKPVEPIVELPPVVVPVEPPAPEPIPAPEPVVPITHEPSAELKDHHHKPKITADEIAARISLTRRFEYINNLFSGNSELFMEFLDQIAYSENAANAMEVYARFYDEHHWKRKGETADDFKALLKKVF